MFEADNDKPARSDTYHLDECNVCKGHTRSKAYRWLGENHWIPALHGANWLGQDLIRQLGRLEPGAELEFDYTGETPGAPQLLIRRSTDGVITASTAHAQSASPAQRRWVWTLDDRHSVTAIAMELLSHLRTCRGADRVILVPPEG
jgi:hypothetical protein